MSTGAAHAAQPSMCAHLLSGGLSQPFCLILTMRTANYSCPQCAADLILRRLAAPGQTPASAAHGVVFNRCDHGSGERACFPCTHALLAELTKRWSLLFFADKKKANALLRVRQHLSRFYDPDGLRATEQRPAKTKRVLLPSITGVLPEHEQASVDRAARRIQRKYQAIRQERSLPKDGSLVLQGRQESRTVVVSPA
jgi:hypothetical protein